MRCRRPASRRSALISDSGGYGKDGHAIIVESAKAAGIELVADETFNPGDTDMTAQLTKIKGSGAQAIIMWTAGKEAAIVAKNREQLKLDLPVYGGSGIARKEFITAPAPRPRACCSAPASASSPEPTARTPRTTGSSPTSRSATRRPTGSSRTSSRVTRTTRSTSSSRPRSVSARGVHGARAAGRDREDLRVRRHRRHVHVLADGPQRPDRRGPRDVRDRGRGVDSPG